VRKNTQAKYKTRVIDMDLNDFGQLVKTLRMNSVDENGNRWTRESLSKAIHLTTNQLGRLERGDRKYLDNQTLQLLADSLQLTTLEKKEFLTAAIGINDKNLFDDERSADRLDKMVEMMEELQIPAYIVDVYGDLIAANSTIMNLYQITPEIIDFAQHQPVGLNVINFVYSQELGYREIVGKEWRDSADKVLLFFRRTTLRYRYTDYFNYILRELLKEKQFFIDWHSSQRFKNNTDTTYERFDFKHPGHGPLKYYATETVVHTSDGELYMLIYNPADSATVQTFSRIKNNHGNRVVKLSSWPQKPAAY